MKIRLPQSFNKLTCIGAAISATSVGIFCLCYIFTSLTLEFPAYFGLVMFIGLPLLLIIGLLLLSIGAVLHRRSPANEDGSDKQQRQSVLFSLCAIFVIFSFFSLYKTTEYLQSDRFCSSLCHRILLPQITAWQTFSHHRIPCSDCHTAKSGSWRLQSKTCGLSQVWLTLSRNYARPIPAPIKELRPAREKCESCHEMQKLKLGKQKHKIYFNGDGKNSRWEIDLSLKTNVHWHMHPDIQIEYQATDQQQLRMTRVMQTKKSTNERVVYGRSDHDDQPKTMDCLDCHNRTGHALRDPGQFINTALAAGALNADLPYIKKAAVEACTVNYESTDQADYRLATMMEHFYLENAREVWKTRRADVDQAIESTHKIYRQNIFPDMKASWQEYPDHLGHLSSPGCFRCHDDLQVSAGGKTISKKCDLCHQITPGNAASATAGFDHPNNVDADWQQGNCDRCHTMPPAAQ